MAWMSNYISYKGMGVVTYPWPNPVKRYHDGKRVSGVYRHFKLKILLVGETLKNTWLDGLAQDCSNSIANILELLQSCTKPSLSKCVFRWNFRKQNRNDKSVHHKRVLCIYTIQPQGVPKLNFIPMTLHDRWGVWDHWQFDCLFNSLFIVTTNKTSKLRVIIP